MLLPQNSLTVAILVSQKPSSVAVEIFSYVKSFFFSNKFA